MDYTTIPSPGPSDRVNAPISEMLGAITSLQKETVDVLTDVLMNVTGGNPPAQEKTEIRCMMDAVKCIDERNKMIFDMAMRIKQALC